MHIGDHHGLASILPTPEQGDSTPHDVLLLDAVELSRELLADGCADSSSSRVVAVGGEVQESAIRLFERVGFALNAVDLLETYHVALRKEPT
eukprot:12099704-Heterocapsa_arctica.AAC.1